MAVGGPSDREGGRFRVHSVGAEFQAVILRGHLPGHAPIGSNSANIESGARPGVGLSSLEVLRTIDGASHIQMIVPNGVPTESGYILAESTVDNGFRKRCRRNIGCREWESPRRCAVPKVLNG